MRYLYGTLALALATAVSIGSVVAYRSVSSRRTTEVSTTNQPLNSVASPQRQHKDAASEWLRQEASFPRIAFRGTLQAHSPSFGANCGFMFWHQVARYRVDEVLSGTYANDTIVVDHPACDGDIFKEWRDGDRVRLRVSVRPCYSDLTIYPGIRDSLESDGPYYIADGTLERD